MALHTVDGWRNAFISVGIPEQQATLYANKFTENRLTEESLPDLTKDSIKSDLEITVLGDVLAILRLAKPAQKIPLPSTAERSLLMKPPSAKLPNVSSEMTLSQFRKFRTDWSIYKQMTNIAKSLITAQLYSCCDDHVQHSIINSIDDLLAISEEDLNQLIQSIATKSSNPAVHRMTFSSTIQNPDEPIKSYVTRLKSISHDCEFSCPNCKFDLQSLHIKDQLTRGLFNETLQMDILAKAGHIKTLEDVVKHAESFEAAQRDQSTLHQSAEIMSARSEYKRRNEKSKQTRPCSGCGSHSHGQQGTSDRRNQCPAWGKVCNNCKIENHFMQVCRQKKHKSSDTANALIAHVRYNHGSDIYTSPTMAEEIPASINPALPRHQHRCASVKIFPDSGASICIAGLEHLHALGITQSDLVPCIKRVTAVGGSQIICKGWIPITFRIGCHTTTQPVYFCEKVDRFYFSRKGCTDVNILPQSFPYTMDTNVSHIHAVTGSIPIRPTEIPFCLTKENTPKLEKFLKDSFAETAFNKSCPFPSMSTPPAHIYLEENSQRYARHTPIPIPFHWKEKVKRDLDTDIHN